MNSCGENKKNIVYVFKPFLVCMTKICHFWNVVKLQMLSSLKFTERIGTVHLVNQLKML